MWGGPCGLLSAATDGAPLSGPQVEFERADRPTNCVAGIARMRRTWAAMRSFSNSSRRLRSLAPGCVARVG